MPAKSRNNRKKPKYTLGSKSKSRDGVVDLPLPSGETCQARRPGVNGLIKAGILDSFDELTAIVQEDHVAPNVASAKPVTAADVKAAMSDIEKVEASLFLMDKLTVYVVVQPAVWIDYRMRDLTQEDGMEALDAWEKRQKDWEDLNAAFEEAEESGEDHDIPAPPVAVRDIDLDDKMFLLNWALGGSSDLKAFREGTQTMLGDVAAIKEVQLPAE